MTNSADQLHDLYSSWRRKPAKQPGNSMAGYLDLESGGLLEVSAAFALLHVIEDQLIYLGARGAKVAVHQRNLKKWMRVPLMLRTGWNSGVTSAEDVVSLDTLDQIEACSSFLDGKVLGFDDERLESLGDIIEQAEALLSTDSELDPALAAYIKRLLSSIRDALNDDRAGRLFDYTAAVERLRVAFQAAAEASPDDEKKKEWRGMVRQIFVGTATQAVIESGKTLFGLNS